MSDDLVRRLRAANVSSPQRISGSNIFAEAADAIEAKDAENERLRTDLRTVQNAAKVIAAAHGTELEHLRQNNAFDHKLRAEHESLQARDAEMTDALLAAESRAELAERALAAAVEVLRPFAEIGTGESFAFATRELPDLVIARPNGSRLAFVGRDDFVAARQFVKEHGKP